MLFGWIISGALMYAIIPGLDFLPALVVAAGVTPTDPILASSVVGKGKFAQEHVPAHIRHLLQAESGSNDGAAFPFLYLALFLLMRQEHSVGTTIGYWILLVILYQIILGIFIGAIVGIAARKLLKFSKRRELIDRESMVAMYVALALLVTGLTTLAGSDDLLAAFACGTAFAWDDWFTESIEESNFSSTIDLLANCAMFIYLGATMPFNAWNNAYLTLTPWRLVVLAIAILALRRLPTIFALHLWIPDIKTRREALFAGHFGPMGVGAIFISTLAASKLPTPNYPPENSIDILALTIQPITYFIVLSSILTHGLTISFFSLGRRVHSRVASISRTFTQGTMTAGDEPSWMSRVKRARNADDIVINRDDEPDLEKAEGGDSGMLAMFGAPSSSGVPSASTSGSGSNSSSGTEVDKNGDEKREHDEMAHEGHLNNEEDNDEHPCKNVLGDDDENKEQDRKRKEAKVHRHGVKGKDMHGAESPEDKSKESRFAKGIQHDDAAREARFCEAGETQTWREGRKIIIDHNDGEDVEVIDLDPSAEDAKNAQAHPDKAVVHVPAGAIQSAHDSDKNLLFDSSQQREESAVKRAAYQMIRKGSIAAVTQAAVAKIKPKDDGLTPAQREEKMKQKLLRDAWCRQEKVDLKVFRRISQTLTILYHMQHYRDADKSSNPREWHEGTKVVSEGRDGGTPTVREMTDEEKAAKAAKHLTALQSLGHPVEAIEAQLAKLTKSTSKDSGDYFSAKGKGKGRASSPMERSARSPPVDSGPSKGPSESPAIEEGEEEPEEIVRPPRTTGLGLELTRTMRPDEDDEDASSEEEDGRARPSTPKKPPAAVVRRPSPVRNNMSYAVRHLFKRSESKSGDHRRGTPASYSDNELSRTATSGIRFATPDRPTRDGNTGTGRALPVVGSSLSVRRVPTVPRQD
ncbi:sodium/hydrogen antiporter, partial [Phenoliferia sp. Uapishka_3]